MEVHLNNVKPSITKNNIFDTYSTQSYECNTMDFREENFKTIYCIALFKINVWINSSNFSKRNLFK